MSEPKNTNMKKVQVKFHHEDSGNCLTTFVTVGEKKRRYFNRFDSGEWYTVYPSNGYWESDTRVKDDVVFEIVDERRKIHYTESNGKPATCRSIYDVSKILAKAWSEILRLKTYEQWKAWLCSYMEKHGYKGYVDNWCFSETGRLGVEEICTYNHLGLDFVVYRENKYHIICGKKWESVYVYNKTHKGDEALCGFIFEEES